MPISPEEQAFYFQKLQTSPTPKMFEDISEIYAKNGAEVPREMSNFAYSKGLAPKTFLGELEGVAGMVGEGVANTAGFVGDMANKGLQSAQAMAELMNPNFSKFAKEKGLDKFNRALHKKAGVGINPDGPGPKVLDFPYATALEGGFKRVTNLKQPQGPTGQVAGTVGKYATGAMIPGGGGALTRLKGAATAGAGAGLMKQLTDNPYAELAAAMLAPLGVGAAKGIYKAYNANPDQVKSLAKRMLHQLPADRQKAITKAGVFQREAQNKAFPRNELSKRTTLPEMVGTDPELARYQINAARPGTPGAGTPIDAQMKEFLIGRGQSRANVVAEQTRRAPGKIQTGKNVRDRLMKSKDEVKRTVQKETFAPAFEGDPTINISSAQEKAQGIFKKRAAMAPLKRSGRKAAGEAATNLQAADAAPSVKAFRQYAPEMVAEKVQELNKSFKRMANLHRNAGNKANNEAAAVFDDLSGAIEELVSKAANEGSVKGTITPKQLTKWQEGITRWRDEVIQVFEDGHEMTPENLDDVMGALYKRVTRNAKGEPLAVTRLTGKTAQETREVLRGLRAQFVDMLMGPESKVPRDVQGGIKASKTALKTLERYEKHVVGRGKLFSKRHYDSIKETARSMSREAGITELHNTAAHGGSQTAPALMDIVSQTLSGTVAGKVQFNYPGTSRFIRLMTGAASDSVQGRINQQLFDWVIRDPEVGYAMLKAPTPENYAAVVRLLSLRGGATALVDSDSEKE
jgi:hypothetical protein